MSNPWGIERVEQREMGCVPACISMLTGIDYDVLPNVTIQCERYGARIARYAPVIDRKTHIVTSWSSFVTYFRINYGVRVKKHSQQPNIPAMRIVQFGGHVAVHLPDGQYIDPMVSQELGGKVGETDIWITATLIGE